MPERVTQSISLKEMEKAELITEKTADFEEGVHTVLKCCMCGEEQWFGAPTTQGLVEKIGRTSWRKLHSDELQLTGHWCGCNYLTKTR